jgi:hypothetical protein
MVFSAFATGGLRRHATLGETIGTPLALPPRVGKV